MERYAWSVAAIAAFSAFVATVQTSLEPGRMPWARLFVTDVAVCLVFAGIIYLTMKAADAWE